MILNSTTPGNMSLRSETGSVFIKHLVNALRSGASIDTIMKQVTSEMSEKKYKVLSENEVISVTNVPQVESSLRKNLIL